MAGDELWVAGVELAKPASRRRRTGGVEPLVADPSQPAQLSALEPGLKSGVLGFGSGLPSCRWYDLGGFFVS